MADRVTSRGVLWEVIAPIVRWPLHSPLRFTLVVIGTITALCLLGSLGRAGGGQAEPAASSSSTSETSSSPGGTSSSSPSSSSPSPSPSSSSTSSARADSSEWGASQEERERAEPAVKVAGQLARDLVDHRKSSREKWWKAISPHLSKTGQKQMKQLSPGKVGFTKLTGDPGLLVTDVEMGEQYTNVAVPTDKGTYLFLVEATGDKSWQVASISKMAPAGDVTTQTQG